MDKNPKPLLLIRADADTRIGAGHVMRALAVAQAWQDRGGIVRILFAQPNPAMASRLRDEGIEAPVLECERGTPEDAAAVVDEVRRVAPAGVLVDGYDFGTDYLLRLQSGGRPVVLFDDYVQATRLPVQAVVNQNLYAWDVDYANAATGSRLLVGPRYLCLRREFRAAAMGRDPLAGPLKRIVVTLGGGDAENVTSRVLEAFTLMQLDAIEVVVLAGAHNPHLPELERRVRSLGSRFTLEVDRRDMPSLLARCDLAVCGAGATCWEMAYMGVATLPIVLAPNQERIAAAIDEHGIGRSLGWHHSVSAAGIARTVQDVLADPEALAAMQSRAQSLFDGCGAERVAQEIADLAVAGFVPAAEVA